MILMKKELRIGGNGDREFYHQTPTYPSRAFWDGSAGEESACNAGDAGYKRSIPGTGRSPGEGNGNPLQYSCLGNPMDRGTWQATVQRITKNQTWLSNWAHTHLSPQPSRNERKCFLSPDTISSYLVSSWLRRSVATVDHLLWNK